MGDLKTLLASNEPTGAWVHIEGIMDSMGMMRGSFAPVKRAALGAVVGYIVGEALRPSFAYSKNGKHREWAFLSGGQGDATIPWWIFPATGAVVLGVFV